MDDENKYLPANQYANPKLNNAIAAIFVKDSVTIPDGNYLSVESIQPNYSSALGYVTAQSANLNSVTNQINYLNSAIYQPSIATAVSGIQSSLASFSSVQAYLPSVAHLSAYSPSIELTRQATIAISNLAIPSVINGLAASIDLNRQPWYEATLAKSSGLSYKDYTVVDYVDRTKYLGEIIGTMPLSAFAAQSSIVKATEYSVFAEKSLCTVTIQNFGSRLSLADEPRAYLSKSFLGLSESYSNLFKSYEADPTTYVGISPSISKIAPLEYFTTAKLVGAISTVEETTPEEALLQNEILYENEILLSSHLPIIDEGLYKMWKGAIEAYTSSNSDRIRHFSTSIRELFTHLIQKLAPDDQIKIWTKDPINFHEGRPTRRSRLLYICRNINNSSFNAFVKKDVDATIAFIDIFQQGTHDLDPSFSPNNLIAIKSKAESTLKFLLEIHFATNN